MVCLISKLTARQILTPVLFLTKQRNLGVGAVSSQGRFLICSPMFQFWGWHSNLKWVPGKVKGYGHWEKMLSLNLGSTTKLAKKLWFSKPGNSCNHRTHRCNTEQVSMGVVVTNGEPRNHSNSARDKITTKQARDLCAFSPKNKQSSGNRSCWHKCFRPCSQLCPTSVSSGINVLPRCSDAGSWWTHFHKGHFCHFPMWFMKDWILSGETVSHAHMLSQKRCTKWTSGSGSRQGTGIHTSSRGAHHLHATNIQHRK